MSKRKEQDKKEQDKRKQHRHTLALDAEVHFREQGVKGMFRCHTRNIGLGGVFLSTKRAPIQGKTRIELVFFARTHLTPLRHRLRARVVRTANDGVALGFPELDADQQQAFRRFLLRAKVAARHRH
jgi:hypothetical protein